MPYYFSSSTRPSNFSLISEIFTAHYANIYLYQFFVYPKCSPKCSTFVLLLPESHPTVSSCILAKRQKHLEAFFIKAVLKDFAKFTGRYLQQALFLKARKLVKLGLDLDRSRCLPMNLTKFLRTSTLWNTGERLLIFLIETVVDRCSIEWLLWKISKLTCQNVPKTLARSFLMNFAIYFTMLFPQNSSGRLL